MFRGVFLAYCAEAGIFLLLAPWMPSWNHAANLVPFGLARELLQTSWVRAAISAFGLLHLIWGLHDLDLFLRRNRIYAVEDPETARHQ
jgi:hypothetical protein